MRAETAEFDEERTQLIEMITYQLGTLEESQAGIQRLREIDKWFDASDRMYYLELSVKSWQLEEEIKAALTEPPSRELLVDWLKNAIDEELSEAERGAYLNLVKKNVPNPALTDLIYYSDTEQAPEEILEIALNYKPALL